MGGLRGPLAHVARELRAVGGALALARPPGDHALRPAHEVGALRADIVEIDMAVTSRYIYMVYVLMYDTMSMYFLNR